MHIDNSDLLNQNSLNKEDKSSFIKAKELIVNRVRDRGDLAYISVEKQLDLIEQLSQFELGRFLIKTGTFNGYYIYYVNSHPQHNCSPNLDKSGKPFTFLEDFILNRAPTSLATQERFKISKDIAARFLYNGCAFASIPCGLMGEFLELNLSSYSKFFFHGIDSDIETLTQAKEFSQRQGLHRNCKFYQRDAWSLNINEKFDLITTDGLTIYESNNTKIVSLYREFHRALRPNGILLTSFLTSPPGFNNTTEWKLEEINEQDALLQKIITVDILNSKWTNFRTEYLVRKQLREAGFSQLETYYDRAHIIAIILARK